MAPIARPVLRFAPSPNGPLHLGHARSALIGARMAKRLGGRFLVRIEDIDTTRTRPAFVSGIFEDLDWLGIAFETPVLHQSEHFEVYGAAAARLAGMGLLYPCFASRTEIEAAADPHQRDPDGALLYPGLWHGRTEADVARAKAAGLPMALRLDMAKALEIASTRLNNRPLTFTERADDNTARVIAADPARWGDAVLVRKETPTSYHLSVVVDDARQNITHVTRGVDLFAATDLHRLLQVLLGLPEPLYQHHFLIRDEHGRKLSKSDGDTSLASLRAAGWSRDDVIVRALAND